MNISCLLSRITKFKEQKININLKIFFLIFFLVLSKIGFSQETEKKPKDASISKKIIYTEDFSGAIMMYKKMLLFDDKNPVFSYKLGFCYLNTFGKQDSAIFFLEKANDLYTPKNEFEINQDEIQFYLARAYRINSMLDSAAILLERLKSKNHDPDFLEVVNHEINLTLEAIDNDFDIENLGNIINSPYTEHSPVISADKTVLIFTSRKKREGHSEVWDDGEYDEDIYISKRIDGKWSEPKPICEKINSTENEASISLSYDGKLLYFYKDEKKGTIYTTQQISEKNWSEPVKLGKNINTRHRETHAMQSPDGKFLYFTSDRPGGYGGLDIYVSEKQADGKWGKAVNLGAGVNTAGDEEGPFIQDSLLYFSSDGHKGYGQFDVFVSKKTVFGTWGYPENLGYPVNSIHNDVYYAPISNTPNAFYCSFKSDGYGNGDIYILTKENRDRKIINIGYIETCSGKMPDVVIHIKNEKTQETLIARPNEIGKFVFITQPNNVYELSAIVDDEVIYYQQFGVLPNTPKKHVYPTISIDDCE